MSRQGNHYEKTIAFALHVFRGDEAENIILEKRMTLPVSKKEYKVTAKNVQIYCKELFQSDLNIKRIEIDRISFFGTLERQ